MPKAFTAKDKAVIREKLLDGARDCVARFGVRKTSVETLARAGGISKGAFYYFYPSKERLFYEVIRETGEALNRKFERSITDAQGPITLDEFIELTIGWIHELEDTTLMSLMRSGELGWLEQRLPPEMAMGQLVAGDRMVVRLFEAMQIPPPENVDVFAGALRAVILTLLHKRSIGERIYREVLRELLSALFDRYIYTK